MPIQRNRPAPPGIGRWWQRRLVRALQGVAPLEDALVVAELVARSGQINASRAYEVCEALRGVVDDEGVWSEDDVRVVALLEVMDRVSGFCSAARVLSFSDAEAHGDEHA